jgi:hypothetical protein
MLIGWIGSQIKPQWGRADAYAMGFASAVHDLKTLVLSFHPAVAIDTAEEGRVERIIDAVAEDLGFPVYVWTMNRGLVRKPYTEQDLHRTTADPAALLAHLQGLKLDALFVLKDLARHLGDASVARAFRDVTATYAYRCATMIIPGTGHSFPPDLDSEVVHFELALPNAKELGDAIDAVLHSMNARTPTRVELTPEEREEVLRALQGMTLNQARQAVARAMLSDGSLNGSDIPSLLETKAAALGDDGVLEYFPAEDNAFDLGGFGRLVEWLERARIGFRPEAAALNLDPPKGLLLVGVQGCGKSLAAKWLAREWVLPLLKLDAGRLYNKYIGETERNLRRAIQVAESMAPAVLWVDEIEKAFAGSKGGVDQDGGVSQRVLATFLTWLQEKRSEVFVVATANDVLALPPELLRKGRFDEIFFVDLPDAVERVSIFEIHLSQRKQNPELFDLGALAGATEGFSGAEIEQVVIASLYGALHLDQLLDTSLLLEEAARTRPLSVSRREDIERLRVMARERFVPVR